MRQHCGCAVQPSKQRAIAKLLIIAGENVMLNPSWDDRKNTDSREENLNRIWNRPSRPGRQPPGPVFLLGCGIALLVGALSDVFQHGNTDWPYDLATAAFGTALIACSIWIWVRRSRRASSVTADSEHSTPPDGPAD
jgi:hypothetical protein